MRRTDTHRDMNAQRTHLSDAGPFFLEMQKEREGAGVRLMCRLWIEPSRGSHLEEDALLFPKAVLQEPAVDVLDYAHANRKSTKDNGGEKIEDERTCEVHSAVLSINPNFCVGAARDVDRVHL